MELSVYQNAGVGISAISLVRFIYQEFPFKNQPVR